MVKKKMGLAFILKYEQVDSKFLCNCIYSMVLKIVKMQYFCIFADKIDKSNVTAYTSMQLSIV